MAFFFVADGFAEVFFEGDEEVEGDVGGLELFVVGVGDVVDEGAVGGEAWGWGGLIRRGRGRRRSGRRGGLRRWTRCSLRRRRAGLR